MLRLNHTPILPQLFSVATEMGVLKVTFDAIRERENLFIFPDIPAELADEYIWFDTEHKQPWASLFCQTMVDKLSDKITEIGTYKCSLIYVNFRSAYLVRYQSTLSMLGIHQGLDEQGIFFPE